MAKTKWGMVRLPASIIEELKRWRDESRARSVGDVIETLMRAGDGGALTWRRNAEVFKDYAGRVLVESAKLRAPGLLAASGDGDAMRLLSPQDAWLRLTARQRKVAITQSMPSGCAYPPEVVAAAYNLGGATEVGEAKAKPGVRYRIGEVVSTEGEPQ